MSQTHKLWVVTRIDGNPAAKAKSKRDDATCRFKARLDSLAKTVQTKEEWVEGYLRENPDATAASVIADYYPIAGLVERLGWLSSSEAEALVQRARRQG